MLCLFENNYFCLQILFNTISTFSKIPSVPKHFCFVAASKVRYFIIRLIEDLHQIVNLNMSYIICTFNLWCLPWIEKMHKTWITKIRCCKIVSRSSHFLSFDCSHINFSSSILFHLFLKPMIALANALGGFDLNFTIFQFDKPTFEIPPYFLMMPKQ